MNPILDNGSEKGVLIPLHQVEALIMLVGRTSQDHRIRMGLSEIDSLNCSKFYDETSKAILTKAILETGGLVPSVESRLQSLEKIVKELGSPSMTSPEELVEPEEVRLENVFKTTELAKPEEAPIFKGWITNRRPLHDDCDRDGMVVVYNSDTLLNFAYAKYDEASDWCLPWIHSGKESGFTASKPAPSPYKKEVLA